MILTGDSLTMLRTLPASSVQCCVTSPPYWGLRDYGVKGQLGLEATPELYVARMVEIFQEVRRVLRDDGTLWLNLGDSYAGSCMTGGTKSINGGARERALMFRRGNPEKNSGVSNRDGLGKIAGLKPKDLVGIPWRVAFALQADGWYLRSDIIWHKPNPMPESVTDRPTKSHEYLFLLAKSERYFYDADAIREQCVGMSALTGGKYAPPGQPPSSNARDSSLFRGRKVRSSELATLGLTRGTGNPSCTHPNGKNKRTVWSITSHPYKGAHFATFPPKLIEPCILAGSRPGDKVLDPFSGAGTTGLVAQQHGRRYIGIELNPEYVEMAEKRLAIPVKAMAA